MAFCLSEYVSGGEIVNTRKNSVHGYLAFHGCDRPVILQLTGNCEAQLAGRHFRFEVPPNTSGEERVVTEAEMDELRLGWIQIGVPARITIDPMPTLDADGKLVDRDEKTSNTTASETHLRLEWFSQNGHTIIHLVNPVIEFVGPDDDKPDGLGSGSDLELDDDELDLELDDDDDDDDELPWDEDEASTEDGDSFAEGEPWNASGEDEHESDDDPFGLFPQDLEAQLDQSAPRPSWDHESDDETLAQWKDWDEVLEGTKDVPLSSLFDPPLKMPPAESLDDQQVALQLTQVLARLALHNVAFHMCEHFTPRSAYKLLLETILPEESTHPELPRIGYTMNFDTAESCEQCAAEFEQRQAEREAKRGSEDPDDLDDDVPF